MSTTTDRVDALRALLVDLCDEANDLAGEMDPDRVPRAAVVLAALREYAAWIAGAVRILDRALGAELDGEVVAVEGVGMVGGAWVSGAWEWGDTEARAAIVPLVAEAARDQRRVSRTGEVESESEAVARVIAEAFSVVPRVKVLRALGIDPERFGSRGEGHHTARIVPGSS